MGRSLISKNAKTDGGYELASNSEGDTRHDDVDFTGPLSKRSCTDVICGILFFIFILFYAALGVWSFVLGDARVIINPKDSDGKICGVDYPTKSKLVFFDITACLRVGESFPKLSCNTPQVCMETCPLEFWSWKDLGNEAEDRKKMICKGGTNADTAEYKKMSIEELVKNSLCAPYATKSESVFERCIPSTVNKISSSIENVVNEKDKINEFITLENFSVNKSDLIKSAQFIFINQSIKTGIIRDLIRTWKIIIVGLIFAAVISLLWIVLLQFFAAITVYSTLLNFVLLFAVCSVLSFIRWWRIKSLQKEEVFYLSIDIMVYLRQAKTWLVFGIITAVLFFIILFMIIFLRKRIQLAIRIFGETSKALRSLMCSLLWPFVPFLLIVGIIGYAVLVNIHLASIVKTEGLSVTPAEARNPSARDWIRAAMNALPCDPKEPTTAGKICHFIRYGEKKYIIYLQVYNIFMVLWTIDFVRALSEMTLAGAFASFYFSGHRSTKQHLPSAPVLMSFMRSLFYHFGSLALGSMLIAKLSFIRCIFLYIERKLKFNENPITQFFSRCMCCCFWCLDKFLRFLNRNAYIMIAIYNQNFCKAAANAFGLITRNALRVFVLNYVTNFVLFVGQLFVAGITGLIAFLFFDGTFTQYHKMFTVYEPKLNYPLLPVLIITIASLMISKIFFTVYRIGVDTIFICACEDLERNDGSNEKPYFMQRSTMEMLERAKHLDDYA